MRGEKSDGLRNILKGEFITDKRNRELMVSVRKLTSENQKTRFRTPHRTARRREKNARFCHHHESFRPFPVDKVIHDIRPHVRCIRVILKERMIVVC